MMTGNTRARSASTSWLLGLALALAPLPGRAATGPEMLLAADLQRAPWDSFGMIVKVENQTPRGPEKRSYNVRFKDGVKTLILFREPANSRGDLVLMVQDDLWFYAHDTRRPIRITPMQRISGSVSYGDITRISWSRDYTVDGATETALEDGKPGLLLNLSARTPGATYQKIDLWLTADKYTPVRADVYLLSGKLFKTMHFLRYQTVDGKFMNTAINIVDHFRKGQSSQIEYERIKERDWPDRIFLKTALPSVSAEAAD